jgi:hypothetical protein
MKLFLVCLMSALLMAQAPPRVSDAAIEKTFHAKAADSSIADEHFVIHVRGGVATIEGKTDVIQHKGVATRFAKKAGAMAVVNNVVVAEAARQKSLANLEKGRQARLRKASVQ